MKAGGATEAFCDGHVSGFSFFGGVPPRSFMINTRIAVARILGDGKRRNTWFSELRSHYLFGTALAAPARGTTRARYEVGIDPELPGADAKVRNFDDLNTHLEACCAKRWAEQLRGHDQTVGDSPGTGSCGSSAPSRNRLRRLRQAPGAGQFAVASALSRHRYSAPHGSAIAMLVRGYVHEVVSSCAAEVIARHPSVHTSKRTSSSIRALSVLAGA